MKSESIKAKRATFQESYRLFDLELKSEVPLAGFPTCEGASSHVRIYLEETVSSRPLPQSNVAWSASCEEIWIRIEGVATYRIRNGCEIAVAVDAGVSLELVGYF